MTLQHIATEFSTALTHQSPGSQRQTVERQPGIDRQESTYCCQWTIGPY